MFLSCCHLRHGNFKEMIGEIMLVVSSSALFIQYIPPISLCIWVFWLSVTSVQPLYTCTVSLSQYSTGPQHNLGCKYKFVCGAFVSFYWYIYILGCTQSVVENDFRMLLAYG